MKTKLINLAILLGVFVSSGCGTYPSSPGMSRSYPEPNNPVAVGDPNRVIRPEENWTVLHQAANSQDFPLVRALVEQGADVRAKARQRWLAGGYGPYNQTPAMVALRWGSTDIARYLTDRSGEDYEILKGEADRLAAKGRAEAIDNGLFSRICG
jgi:ankyrin repeat protein